MSVLKPEDLIIKLEIEWEKAVGEVTKYNKCGFTGGYSYNGYPNAASCNGGYGSPDFYMTLSEVKQKLFNQYSTWEQYKNRKIKFKVTVKRDDRNPTIESFF